MTDTTDDTTMIREAMDRTTEGLPPLPDLAPVAVRLGRRRRARARLTVVGGAFATVTAAALGLTLLPGDAGGGPAVGGVGAAPEAPPTPYRTPVKIDPTPGEESGPAVPEAERDRQARFQQRAAGLFDELLPPVVTDVRPVDGRVNLYQVRAQGRNFTLKLTIRPVQADDGPLTCTGFPAKGGTCEKVALDGGREAYAYRAPVNEMDTFGARIAFAYGKSRVTVEISPSEEPGRKSLSSPVTARELTALAEDRGFTDLVADAEKNPVETYRSPVRGG
ncbi:hypothetical protein AB0C77_02015 [Streptomyces sp. NPDC048629]|uniref:hypothetical protein n=1 Tax=Streptomyces sp. NPDC048629 TaxID=3154824 RepID=UPI003420E422